MFRLLGFLIGSVAAITIMLLVLGVPDFHLPDAANDQQRFDAAVEKLKEKQQATTELAERVVGEVASAVDSVQDPVAVVADKALPEAVAAVDAAGSPVPAEAAEQPAPDGSPRPDPFAAEPSQVDPAAADGTLQWYSFWNPFRSELAANGFMSQLEKVTGLDYRVVKVKNGVYEVAFAYADDQERQSKLSRIAMATGLNLPGS